MPAAAFSASAEFLISLLGLAMMAAVLWYLPRTGRVLPPLGCRSPVITIRRSADANL